MCTNTHTHLGSIKSGNFWTGYETQLFIDDLCTAEINSTSRQSRKEHIHQMFAGDNLRTVGQRLSLPYFVSTWWRKISQALTKHYTLNTRASVSSVQFQEDTTWRSISTPPYAFMSYYVTLSFVSRCVKIHCVIAQWSLRNAAVGTVFSFGSEIHHCLWQSVGNSLAVQNLSQELK